MLASGLPPSPLLERESPLAELARWLGEAASGEGRLVLVGGEAGVGKTSLVRRFARDRGARVLWGACDPLSLPRPLGPLVDVAPALGGPCARLLEAEESRARIFTALRAALEASTVVLVFEDMHWADDATLDLLRYLGRRLDRTRSLVLATYRDDEVGPTHPLRRVMGDLASSPACRRLALLPLSAAAVRELASDSGLDATDLHQRTGGNPFFVTEVLAAGTALPETLCDAVLARAARLDPAARRVLDLAAVLGARFDALLLDAVADAGEVPLEACLSSGMLARDGASLAFRHELAREAILSAIGPARAAALHRRVLAARRALPSGPDDLATLAHHAEAAGDREAVLEFAPAAARRAAALRSHREAAAQFARALRCADLLPDVARAELLEAHAYECYLTNQIAEAVVARTRALEIWRPTADRSKVGENLRWLSRLAWFLGRNGDAEGRAREALAVLEPAGETLQLAWAQSNYAQLHMLAGRQAETVTWGERAIATAERLGAREVLCHALNNVGTARGLMAGSDAGVAMLERSLALALEDEFEEHVARAYTNLASVSVHRRVLSPARRFLGEGLAYCAEHDLDSWVLYMSGWRALAEFWEGRFAEAAATASGMLRQPALAVPSRIQPLVVLARVRVRRGDPGADELLDEALALAESTGELQRVGMVRAARAEAAWLAGDLETTRAEAGAAFPLAVAAADAWFVGELGFWLWRGIAPGDASPASSITGIGAAPPYGLQIDGQPLAAAELWRKMGCPYEAAMALADLDDEAALRSAHQTLLALGAGPLADRVARRLRERGARGLARRPRAATRGNPGGLTARELDVLRLVAAGLRDADIAERLCLSPRTVGHHVSALLGKLGARGRAEAAGRAAHLLESEPPAGER